MLQKIRDHAQGWFAYTIVALLTVPFAVWGINYYFEGGGPLDAATVGDSKISLQEYQRAYQQQRQRLQAMLGNNVDPAILEGPRLKQDVLRQLVDERVLTQLIQDQRMRVSDQQLLDALMALPVFQQNGGFNKELYERLLRNQGYSPSVFEEGLRQSLATEQLRNGVVASALATPADLEQLVALLKQQRELYYLTLPLAPYVAKAQAGAAAVQDYFSKNADRFVNPEQVRVQFIEMKIAGTADQITISEDELRAAYTAQLTKYGQPEERSASHLLIKLPATAAQAEADQAQAKAQRLAEELRSGAKTLDQLLQEAKTDPASQMEGGNLGVINKGMYDNPALENALYALEKTGDISAPVRMPSGFHVLRLDRINPAKVKPFEEVRDSIAQELRQQQAENRFYEATQTLANLGYEHPDSLEPAAKALALTIQESPWFSRQGGEGIAKQVKVAESAFSEDVLKRGLNSEPLELEAGHVVMLRVREQHAATPRTLEESREEITKTLREQQARDTLAKDIEALKARAARGEHLQVLAKALGGEFKRPGLVGRDAPSVDPTVLTAAFRLPQPEAGKVALGSATLANGDQVLLVVERVVAGQKEALSADERKTLARQMAQQSGSGQFEGLLDSVRAKTKVVMHSDRL